MTRPITTVLKLDTHKYWMSPFHFWLVRSGHDYKLPPLWWNLDTSTELPPLYCTHENIWNLRLLNNFPSIHLKAALQNAEVGSKQSVVQNNQVLQWFRTTRYYVLNISGVVICFCLLCHLLYRAEQRSIFSAFFWTDFSSSAWAVSTTTVKLA